VGDETPASRSLGEATLRAPFPRGDVDVSAPNFLRSRVKSANGTTSNSIGQAKRRPMFADELLSSSERAQAVPARERRLSPLQGSMFFLRIRRALPYATACRAVGAQL